VESLPTVSWSFLVDLPVDDAVRYFYEVLYSLFDEHVPLSSMKNSYSSPWFTRQLSYLKNKKTRLFKRFKISGLQTDFIKYSSANVEFFQYNSVQLQKLHVSSILNGNLAPSLSLSQ